MGDTTLRVQVDSVKCEGFGTCAVHCPELFELDDLGYASVIGDGEVTPELRETAVRAVLDCPTHAIHEIDS